MNEELESELLRRLARWLVRDLSRMLSDIDALDEFLVQELTRESDPLDLDLAVEFRRCLHPDAFVGMRSEL